MSVVATNGWMDEDATWYGSRPQHRPYCVRRGPGCPRKGHRSSPSFRPCLLWPQSLVSATAELLFHHAATTGVGILQNAETSQGIICGKSTAERYANYPLSLFRIPQLKNSAFPRIAKLPFARIVQLMCSRSTATSGVPRCLPSVFFVVRLPKNRVVFSTSINFKVCSTFQVSHHFAGQCDWLQSV